MAPALNEPMSPTEKLSNSTAKVAPPSRSTKSANESGSTTSTSLNTNSEQKVKGYRRSSVSTPTPSSSTSNSTRITRSKDAYQRVFEQAVSPTSLVAQKSKQLINTLADNKNTSVTDTSLADGEKRETQKEDNISNEPMGLSIIPHNKGISIGNDKNIVEAIFSDAEGGETLCKETESNINNNNNTSISCKSNSTEQLLADLTNDIEESITTKVCIRKHLQEVAVGKNGSNKITSTNSETKEFTNLKFCGKEANKINAAVSPSIAQSSQGDERQRMEVELLTECNEKSENCLGSSSKAQAQKITISNEKKRFSDVIVTTQGLSKITPTIPTEEVNAESVKGTSGTLKSDATTRIQILSVDVLPPISTDSTMTASEVEDNLEERLSQLDGTAMASPTCEEGITPVSGTIVTLPVSTTPPCTPTKHQTHHQQVQQLQLQLQQTPPTPLSNQVRQLQHSFTPQSSTSSVNTLNSTNLPPAFMKEGGAGELEDQDLEEVLKVLKGFDGSAGADTLCDLNVLFNEEYTLYEDVGSQVASTSNKPSPLKEMQNEIERNQQAMHRKIDFLLRRLRKIQSRYMSKHCSEEIAGLFEWTARISVGKGNAMNRVSDLLCPDTAISVIAARPPANNWADEKNPVASTQMSSMLRRLEQSSNAQQLCMVPTNSNLIVASTQMSRKSKKALLQDMQTAASTSTANASISTSVERKGEIVVPNYDINVSEELAQVAGLLQTEMREVQTSMDSDATESSSGGESADEMVTYNNQIQQPLAIAKRAAWRYSRDRAAIAARWSWLLSQIADLEIKIRQHTELRQEIVRTKGSVVCGQDEPHVATNDSSLKTSEISAINITTTSVNGYKGNLVGNTSSKLDISEADGTGLMGTARTRGFVPSLFRKRKLLQTQSLHTISKKAARPSNIKCGCQWPFNPCALCTGRIDPTAPRDPPDTMMMADRIALLDPGYHPVLSFREDVSSTLHLEAIARIPEWQHRVMRCQVKSIAKSVWKAEREAERAAGLNTSKKYNEPTVKRRYTKKKDRLAMDEKNAAAAAAATATATATTANSANASLSTIGFATDSSANLTKGVGPENGGAATNVSAASANETTAITATTTSLPASDGGNGTGILSTSTTTTPLVANKVAKKSKKLHHYHLVGDGVLLEPPRPLSPVATNHSSHSQSSYHSQQSVNSNSVHQTSDNPPQNYDPYSPNPIHSSSISSNSNGLNGGGGGSSSGIGNHKHNKHRKSSASSTSMGNANNNNSSSNNTHFQHQNNYATSNYTGESNDANWDGFATRSRTSSPTHTSASVGNSNYHKYERSKNRTSYDIDNIVIPYSVAAATRVEILQYKEIPTPKWRVIEDDRTSAVESTDTANITDNAVTAKTNGDERLENNLSDIVNETSSDITTAKPNEDAKKEKTEQSLSVEKTTATTAENKTEASEERDVTKEVPPVDEEDTSNKIDAPIEETSKVLDHKKNNVLSHNVSTKTESENIKADATTATATATSDEPTAKKLKHEDASSTVEGTVAAETETVDDPNTGEFEEIKTTASESILALKRTARLKRSDTFQEDNFEYDATADEVNETEDISDETVKLRHERALVEERRKFQTYLKYPWSTRSRANRRIDSRAESSGANTPDPTSPAPQTAILGGGDHESIPSPAPPATPLNPLDTVTELTENGLSNAPASSIGGTSICANNNDLNKRLERRRTTSTKRDRETERRSSTPDPKELVPPYEPLKFPLTNEEFEGLLKAMPVEFHYLNFDAKYLEDCNNTGAAASGSKYPRHRNSWRGDGSAVVNRRGKSIQNCDVTTNKRQRVNGGKIRKGSKGGRGRRRGNHTRVRFNNEAVNNCVNSGGADEVEEADDDDDDDDVDLMMFLAEEDDDYDYPKHHLAPDDDLYEGGAGSAGCVGPFNGGARDRMMDIDDEYEAYLGRRHRDSDADSTDSEPFADDDPNDPEWRGESEDRGGGGGNERQRRTVR
ncbi:serine-rich adhesin for platelets isoform X1 [Bactrocera neohumeralis]|uniref:serine-rich adhesin for platelets isoform X1 n=1 Tax=Bactrocera neohumeralis TaxID=98809 RepID=UPI00216597E7|nr:serine-rich adhesin for platelets isoform X1 [Bactrocera neohumeralis]